MIRLFVLATALVLIASQANANVDATPDPYDPRVRVEATIKKPAGGASAERPTYANSDRLPKRPDYSEQCLVDEVTGQYGCADPEPDPLGRPDLTEGEIRRAVEEIGLPRLDVQVQPSDTTLVNVATIFSTQPATFEHSVFLLGYNVDLVAEPLSYDWQYGDGTHSTTTQPGRPYPAMDITHAYLWKADDVRPSVDVEYEVAFRVDGGTWRHLSDTIVADGPAATLDVKEAVPVLAKR